MIIGTGIDIVSIPRIDKVYKKFQHKFTKKILSHNEIEIFNSIKDDRKVQFLAKHWATKEAVSKAIGCGLINGSPLHFIDIALEEDFRHKPIIRLNKKLIDIISKTNNIKHINGNNLQIHISTSGDANLVIANAILEKNN